MSFWDIISRLKMPEMPPAKDVANIPAQLKEATIKGEANQIFVKYFSASGPFTSDGVGTIVRDTKNPICYCRIPEPQAFVMRKNSVRYNLTTKRSEIFLLEGYTASLVMGEAFAPYQELEKYGMTIGRIGPDGLLIPVMPEELEQIDCTVEIDGEQVDVIPKTLSQMGTAKWMDGMTDKPVSGVAVIFLLGALAGGFAALLISAIARGSG